MKYLLLSLFLISGCTKSDNKETPTPIKVDEEKRTIAIQADSPFLKHLSSLKVKTANSSSLLKEKSSVIAIKETSGWKFLNDDLAQKLGALVADDKDSDGIVLRTRLSLDLAENVHVNDKVFLATDSSSTADRPGTIISIEKNKNSDVAEVYIKSVHKVAVDLLDFYWVDFKYKTLQTYLVPIKAILYISNEEYVLKKISATEYIPKHVSIVSHADDGVIVFGGLQASDEVLAEGSILLKPIVEDLVAPTYESQK